MKVGIIMGSKSDLDTMKKASAVLDEFNIPYEMVIASAHRTPEAVKNFVTRLEDEGAIAFIAVQQLIYLALSLALRHYLLSVFLLMQQL